MLILLASCLALASIDAAWTCACWFHCAYRRRARKPRRHHPRRAAILASDSPGKTPSRFAHWRSKPEWACREVIYLAAHGRSCREIEALFNRKHGVYMTVGHSWVAEYIKGHAAEIAERRHAMRRNPPAFFAVNHTWALDLTFLVNDQGFAFTMLGIIDHGSRRLLCLKQLPRKCTLTLLGHLFLTMARCGVPATIRTDNESMFVSALWNAVFAALGICHRRSRPACPWQNGRIERLFGTLKPLLKSIRPNTVKALRQTLAEFTWFYNHMQVHQNLRGLTPVEVWNGKTLADVQQAHMRSNGRWVQAHDGRLTGYHARC